MKAGLEGDDDIYRKLRIEEDTHRSSHAPEQAASCFPVTVPNMNCLNVTFHLGRLQLFPAIDLPFYLHAQTGQSRTGSYP